MITIDGSRGEGGGQVLRTSLALSLVTGRPFRIVNIRAGREKPGLLRQHLTALKAATEIGGAEVSGAAIGSRDVVFRPGRVRPGEYAFAVGTAGSATLVLQTVLPALMTADAPSTIALEGGTHNPFAPPFDFLERAFLPLVCRMGPEVEIRLERPGFFPAGGGRFTATVVPSARIAELGLADRGALRSVRARAVVAHLPFSIAERELAAIAATLPELDSGSRGETASSRGPGNVVTIEVESEHVTEVFTGFGAKGVPAETVADRAAAEARHYLATPAAVGEHLADQLLLPLALAGGGNFTTVEPSSHTRTNVEVIERFLDVAFAVTREDEGVWRVAVDRRE
jgi:RNA 3'-terminal phosphate cyclase (ATP)